MRHDWFQRTPGNEQCHACGDPDCVGHIALEFCPLWQEAEARCDRSEYLTVEPGERVYLI